MEDNNAKPLVPEYGEVLDLLKTLPDAIGSPVASRERPRGCSNIDGDQAFPRSRIPNVTPPPPLHPSSCTKEMFETLSRTSSQYDRAGGVGSGVGGGGCRAVPFGDRVSSGGTLPHSVKRTTVERRKSSLTEFSTVC